MRRSLGASFCLLVALGFAGAEAQAVDTTPTRWLSGVEVSTDDTGSTIEVGFAAPLAKLSHSPDRQGRLVEIVLTPAAPRDRSRNVFRAEESVRRPAGTGDPLREVRLEPQAAGQALLVLQFDAEVAFRVALGAGGRRLQVRVKRVAESARVSRATAAASEIDVSGLMEEGRRALADGQYDKAIALYTKVLSLPGGETRADALEYLGLARQRNGQRAHARAEYALYLARFPDTEGAARVQQRLDALLSSASSEHAPLRGAKSASARYFDTFGMLSTSYQRAESFADLSGAVMLDSSQIVDADVTTMMKTDRFDVRLRGSGYYRYDFLDGETGDGSRISDLNLEVRDRDLRLRGILGRQSSRGGGVLGRFDGASASWSFLDDLYVGAAFGFPQDSWITNSVDRSRLFGGMRVGVEGWRDQFSGEVWAMGQSVDGLIDRLAVGYEARWMGRFGSLMSAVDYDIHYAALNLAMLTGSLELFDGTTLNAWADYRHTPFLTTRNALMGQNVDSISDLEATFSTAEIQALAIDRTPTSMSFSGGVDQRLTDRWRVSGDFTASKLSSTSAGGGVPGTPSTGWEFFYLAQLSVRDSWIAGDSHRLGLRVIDGFRYIGYTASVSGRYPLLEKLWLTPRFDFDYRDHQELSDRIAIRPGLRAEYRIGPMIFETDVRAEWLRSVDNGLAQPSNDAVGYLLYVTATWVF